MKSTKTNSLQLQKTQKQTCKYRKKQGYTISNYWTLPSKNKAREKQRQHEKQLHRQIKHTKPQTNQKQANSTCRRTYLPYLHFKKLGSDSQKSTTENHGQTSTNSTPGSATINNK